MRGSLVFVEFLFLAATASFFSPDGRLRAQSVAAEQDLLLGSWQLNLVKSGSTPGPPPRSEVRTYVRDNEGMQGHHSSAPRRRARGSDRVSSRLRSRVSGDGYPAYNTNPSQTSRCAHGGGRPLTRGACVWNSAPHESLRMAGLLRSRSVKRTREFSRAT